MARILMGWSYGAGFGHVGRLLAIALGLAASGHTVTLALSDVDSTRPIWEGKGFEVLRAPTLRLTRLPRTRETETIADTLNVLRFGEHDNLLALGRAWNTILAGFQPNLVICDYCPHLALAARGRVPVITVGTGFTVPPGGKAFPPMEQGKEAVSEEGARVEAGILEVVNRAARDLGNAELARASDMFAGDAAFACCLPELDPYQAHRDQPAIGGFLTAPPKSGPSEPRVFAYLAAEGWRPAWLEGLAASGLPGEAYIRGLDANAEARAHTGQILLHDRPADLFAVLPMTSLILHHGGANTTELAMRMGVSQLIIPMNREQQITGKLVKAVRAGGSFGPSRPSPETLAREIQVGASDPSRQTRALGVATRIAARNQRPALDVVLEACGKYL